MTRSFIIVGNKAVTAPFSLNDLAGAAGRMDLLCRSLSTAFFLSHDMRRDVVVHILLLGEPNPPRCIRFSGTDLRYMGPDERNIGGLIRKALDRKDIGPQWVRSTPGIDIAAKDLGDLLNEVAPEPGEGTVRMSEGGSPVEDVPFGEDPVFLLGDHNGLTPEQERLVEAWPRVSLGDISYHTDHCITILNHTLDKRG